MAAIDNLSAADQRMAFPVAVSADGRYFVDRTGRPVFWLGTTQWELFRGYSLEDAGTILKRSAAHGFAFAQVMVAGVGDGTDPNVYGDSAWRDGDPLKPNEDYFRHVDAVLRIAAERGIAIVMLVYHQRYCEHVTVENARRWAAWVARRYRDVSNIVWLAAPEATEEYVPVLRELASGLREGDGGRHLITLLPDPSPFSSSFVHAEPWLDFDSIQTWRDVHLIRPMVTHDYGLQPVKPVVMAEGAYEAGTEYGFDVTPLWVRRQAYYSFLSGAHHAYGHNDSWRVLPTWRQALDAPGAVQMGILKRTFADRREWWLFEPDQSVLASGGRTEGDLLRLSARHRDGLWAMVYLADEAEFSVDMGRLAGDVVQALWVDPRTGHAVSVGSFSTTGRQPFSTPEGWEDALLVLEAVDDEEEVPRFGMFEAGFGQAGNYANPYRELSATATLRRPDGGEWTIPLFWDGGGTWKLRFSPDLVGRWSYDVRSADAGLDGQSGSFRCVESDLRGSFRPMAGHPLHFEYQDGTPVWFFGDKAWRVLQTDRSKKLDRASAMHHVDVRAAQGFNYMHTELAGTGGMTSGGNEGGEMFLDVGSEVINPAFFQEVDARLRHINEHGLVFGLVVLYARGDPSWRSLPDDEARMRFARYAVARYSAFDMVFLVAGEWQYMPDDAEFFRAVGREIRRTDPHGRMIGIHPGPGGYISSQEFAGDEWMSFGEYAQAYFAPDTEEATDADRDRLRAFIVNARRHGKPVVDAEYAYYLRDQDFDGVVDKPHSHTRTSFRRASWVIPMGGGYFVTGFGTTYYGGRREVGPFFVDDPRHADAVADLDRLHRFFTALDWWLLEPHDELVRANGGYAYCLAHSGSTYVVYVAGSGGAELTLPGGDFTVRRYDPRTGDWHDLTGPVGGTARLDAPDAQDWVFLVQARMR